MKIITNIGRGVKTHAADYDPATGTVSLYCDSLKYEDYLAAITDLQPPTPENVTCKKCLKKLIKRGWANE